MAAVLEHAQEFGIDPVPMQHRVLGTWDTYVLWADLGISFLVMVVGTLLVPGLGLGGGTLPSFIVAFVLHAGLGRLVHGRQASKVVASAS